MKYSGPKREAATPDDGRGLSFPPNRTAPNFGAYSVSDARNSNCGYEDHEHTPDCYDASGKLICGKHAHSDACYDADGGSADEGERTEDAEAEPTAVAQDEESRAEDAETEDAGTETQDVQAQNIRTQDAQTEDSQAENTRDEGTQAEDAQAKAQDIRTQDTPAEEPQPEDAKAEAQNTRTQDAPAEEPRAEGVEAEESQPEETWEDEETDLPLVEEETPDEALVDVEELTFTVGNRQSVLLSEIMDSLDLHIGHIVSVGQVVYSEDEQIVIEVVETESDYEIILLSDFSEAELAIATRDETVMVKLTDGRHTGDADEAFDDQTGEQAQETAPELNAESVPTDGGDEAADENGALGGDAVDDEEAPMEEADEEATPEAGEEVDEETAPEAGEEADGEPDQEGEAPEDEAVYTYTFEKQKSVFLTSLLAEAGIAPEGKLRAVTSSDPEAILIRGPFVVFGYVITARASFDAATLTVTCDAGTLDILLSNPEEGERMAPGDELVTDDGKARVVFAEEVVLPEGTTLTVEERDPDLDSETWDAINRELEQAEGESEGDLRWFDISLGDVHEVRATVTLADVANPGDDVIVVHVTHENEIVVIDDAVIGEDGSVTFDTEGFSPVGVDTLLEAEGGAKTLTLDEPYQVTINNTSQHLLFTPENDHGYSLTATGLGSSAYKYFYLYDDEGTQVFYQRIAKSTTSATLDLGVLSGDKTYELEVNRGNSTAYTATLTPKLGSQHVYDENHVCSCGELEPWYIDENNILHVQTDAGAASKG